MRLAVCLAANETCHIFSNFYPLSGLILLSLCCWCIFINCSFMSLCRVRLWTSLESRGHISFQLISLNICHDNWLNRCSINVCWMNSLMNQQLLWSVPVGKWVWLLFWKKWKVCNGFGVRPRVFPYQVWDNTLSACPWTWRESIGWHTIQTYHIKWQKASYDPVLSPWTFFFFNWPAVATALCIALPSLCQ